MKCFILLVILSTMNKLSKTLILSTLLTICSGGYSSTIQYNPLDEHDKQIFDNCGIETTANSSDFGKLFYLENNNKKWLMYDNKYCYDLQTLILSIGNSSSFLTEFPNIGDGGNLLVKTCDDNSSKTYTLKQPKYYGPCMDLKLPANTNLIVPLGITLDCYDVCLSFVENSNLYILGTVQNAAQKSKNDVNNNNDNEDDKINEVRDYSYLYFYSKPNQNIIIGPKATYNWAKDNTHQPISISSSDTNLVLYPGCIIKDHRERFNKEYGTTLGINFNLYLNRYIKLNNTNK